MNLLHNRGINLAWLCVPEPYIQLQQECKRLAEDPDFSSMMARYVEETGNLPRSLKIFYDGLLRGQNNWSTVPPDLQQREKHGFYAERWKNSFAILRGELGYFLTDYKHDSPLFSPQRRRNYRCPALEDVRNLLREPDFVKFRHAFQHTNFAFEERNDIECIVAYDVEGGSTAAYLRLQEAEAFHLTVCSIVDILIATILAPFDPKTAR